MLGAQCNTDSSTANSINMWLAINGALRFVTKYFECFEYFLMPLTFLAIHGGIRMEHGIKKLGSRPSAELRRDEVELKPSTVIK